MSDNEVVIEVVGNNFTPTQTRFLKDAYLYTELGALLNLMEKSQPVINNKAHGFKPDLRIEGRDVYYPGTEVLMAFLRAMDAKAKLESTSKENQEMRMALCIAHAKGGAYLDDGEMQDNSAHPCIDWKRDTWDAIKAKLAERSRQALEEAERTRQEGLKKLQAEIDAGAVKIEDLSPESADLVIAENRRKLEAEGVLPVTDADLKRFGLDVPPSPVGGAYVRTLSYGTPIEMNAGYGAPLMCPNCGHEMLNVPGH